MAPRGGWQGGGWRLYSRLCDWDFYSPHGDFCIMIVSVAKGVDGSLRALDLLETRVRASVRVFDGAKVDALYDSAAAVLYL